MSVPSSPALTTNLGEKAELIIFWLILLNILAMILETVTSLHERFSGAFVGFEVASVLIFTIEYASRLYVAPRQNPGVGGLTGRLRYALTPMALVDLVAILPFFIPFLLPIDLRFVRALRLLRIARIFKLGRYSRAMSIILDTVRAKREELVIASSFVGGLLLVSSSLMYVLERNTQPDAFGSIPQAMWWGVATLTTVGYGDVFPITPLGRFFGALTAITCIGLFALPAGILASGFSEAITKHKQAARACPHCGKELP